MSDRKNIYDNSLPHLTVDQLLELITKTKQQALVEGIQGALTELSDFPNIPDTPITPEVMEAVVDFIHNAICTVPDYLKADPQTSKARAKERKQLM